jgi:hypothetical protein
MHRGILMKFHRNVHHYERLYLTHEPGLEVKGQGHCSNWTKSCIILRELQKIFTDRLANNADHYQMAGMCPVTFVCAACIGRNQLPPAGIWSALVTSVTKISYASFLVCTGYLR